MRTMPGSFLVAVAVLSRAADADGQPTPRYVPAPVDHRPQRPRVPPAVAGRRARRGRPGARRPAEDHVYEAPADRATGAAVVVCPAAATACSPPTTRASRSRSG